MRSSCRIQFNPGAAPLTLDRLVTVILSVGPKRRRCSWLSAMAGASGAPCRAPKAVTSPHLTDGLANTCTFMHLAAVSLGCDPMGKIHVQEPFKKVLGVPDLMML